MATVDKCERSAPTTSALSRSRSTDERALRRRIYELLGKPRMASGQFHLPEKGWMYSRARTISASQFYAHLRGQSTLALSPLSRVNGRALALFICLAID